MARLPDATDCICQQWARTRRELLGITNPTTQREFLGAVRCTLGNVQLHRDGAGSRTTREQFFPEVYTGDALLVNLAYKRMPPELRPFMDLHYCLGRGACRRADLLGISQTRYWAAVNACKRFIEGYIAARQERAA